MGAFYLLQYVNKSTCHIHNNLKQLGSFASLNQTIYIVVDLTPVDIYYDEHAGRPIMFY